MAKKKAAPEPPKFDRCPECGVTAIVCRLRARPIEKGSPCCGKCEHKGAGNE